jgi:CheY-like chemotaxis protein
MAIAVATMEIESDLSTHQQELASAIQLPVLNILVVEDNLTNQKVIVRQLQSLGYEPDIAATGQAALDAVAQKAYDIVLMDCRLPEMNGYTATRLIRQHEQQFNCSKSIIIALTASNEPQVKQEAMAAGMDDFLTKPLRREILAETLNYWGQHLDNAKPLPAQPIPIRPPVAEPETTLWKLHFDLMQLHQLSDHNLEFEHELLQLYLTDTKDQLQQLQQAIGKQNLQHIERIAHHIKGASASVGAKQLKQIAEQLEQQARQQQADMIALSMLQLKQAFKQIQTLFDSSGKIILNH